MRALIYAPSSHSTTDELTSIIERTDAAIAAATDRETDAEHRMQFGVTTWDRERAHGDMNRARADRRAAQQTRRAALAYLAERVGL